MTRHALQGIRLRFRYLHSPVAASRLAADWAVFVGALYGLCGVWLDSLFPSLLLSRGTPSPLLLGSVTLVCIACVVHRPVWITYADETIRVRVALLGYARVHRVDELELGPYALRDNPALRFLALPDGLVVPVGHKDWLALSTRLGQRSGGAVPTPPSEAEQEGRTQYALWRVPVRAFLLDPAYVLAACFPVKEIGVGQSWSGFDRSIVRALVYLVGVAWLRYDAEGARSQMVGDGFSIGRALRLQDPNDDIGQARLAVDNPAESAQQHPTAWWLLPDAAAVRRNDVGTAGIIVGLLLVLPILWSLLPFSEARMHAASHFLPPIIGYATGCLIQLHLILSISFLRRVRDRLAEHAPSRRQ